MGFWRVPSAPNPFTHDADAAARRPNELRLQIAALRKNRAGGIHFLERAINVAGLKLNSAAAIQDDMRVQSELPSIQHAVFYAVVQRQAHKVDVLDRSLLQIISKTSLPSMGV